MKFIIDTGAENSIINPLICNPKWKIETTNQPIRVLNRNININTSYSFPLFKEFNESENYYVKFIEYNFHNKFSGIIGNNILVDLDAIINYKERLIRTRNANIQFYLNEEEEFYADHCYNDNAIQIFCNEENNKNIIETFAKHLNKDETNKLKKELLSHKDVFYKEGDNLSFTNKIKHKIKLKNEAAIYSKLYRYPEIHRLEVERQIQEMLEQKIIKHSDSQYNSPIWVVPKKIDNSGKQQWRIVVDYRKLNEQTIDDKYPIPNIDELFDKLGKCIYFSTIDLAKGFHQIEMSPEDQDKTAFSTASGHYEYNRMPFGLKNAPATFQRLMNNVLREHINKTCVVYLDDILIFSTSFEEHLLSIRKILETLKEANLKIQINKCNFASLSTNYLGYIITKDGIQPDTKKTEAIQLMKLPRTVKEIKQFLGITGYYRKFIKDYAKVAYPMIKYLKKNAKMNNSDQEYIEAFAKLKLLLINDPILNSPDFNKDFELTTDASNDAIGAVLSQNNHPNCYASRTLNDHEKRYSTIEKELLAIVWSVKYFRTYLYGRKFNIRTDHKPLVWLNNIKEPNMKLQRWKLQLNEYDFTINYLQGKENYVADGLSRIVYTNESDNIPDEIMSTDATIHSAMEDATHYIEISERAINLYKNQIYLQYGEKEKFVTIIKNKKIQNHITIDNNTNLLKIMEKILIDKGVMCIYCENLELFIQFQNNYVNHYANNTKLKLLKSNTKLINVRDKEEMLSFIKDEHLRNNHRGINEIFMELKQKYYYSDLLKLITKFINNCDICKLAKHDRHPIKIPYKVTETPTKFNDLVHIDIWFPCRNKMYLTTIDKFSKYATIHKLDDRTWISILKVLKERILFLGKMEKLIFDNERCILHNAVELFLKENNIQTHVTTAGHKTGNSDIERLHGTLNEHLRLMTVESKTLELDEMVHKAILFYNNTIHNTTKLRPIDFITKNFDRDYIKDLSSKYEQDKIKKIDNINKTRNSNFELSENIVSNRAIGKNKPKYKKLTNYNKNNGYTYDISNNRKVRYNQNQQKRKYKFQND